MKSITKYRKAAPIKDQPRSLIKLDVHGQPFVALDGGPRLSQAKLVEIELLEGGTALLDVQHVLEVEEDDGTTSYYDEQEVNFFSQALTIEKKKYPAAFDRYSGQTGTKIFPSDFIPNEDNITFNAYIEERGAESADLKLGIRAAFDDEDYSKLGPSYDHLLDHNTTGRGSLFAFIDIPDGGQFEELYLNVLNHPDGTGTTVEIFEGFNNFTPARVRGTNTITENGEQTLYIDFSSTPIRWNPFNYAAIKLTFSSKYNMCYGGIIGTAITQVS